VEEHTKSNLSAQEVVELLDSQGYFELLKMPYPTEQSGVMERLERERLVDRIEGSYAIRRIGALLLAKRLEDFPELARKAPRVVVYTGTSKLETRLDLRLAEGKSAIVSQVISATIAFGLVKSDEAVGGSRKFARYLPFWA
jgi:predicted HTH transcriptional regulator